MKYQTMRLGGSRIQLTDSAFDEPSLTLWHCGRAALFKSVIVVADGVPKMETGLARLRSGQSCSDEGVVSCKGKHGIATEVRDTDLRFSMTITTPANGCQSRSDGSKGDPNRARQLSMVRRNQEACCACTFHSSQSQRPLSVVYSMKAILVRGQVTHGTREDRDVLERALIFLLFLRRRRDLFFFHLSRILRFVMSNRGG